jgi:hypothetical protein
MSTDATTPVPDDETRVHPAEPAEGEDPTSAPQGTDERRHATEPAEGEDRPD